MRLLSEEFGCKVFLKNKTIKINGSKRSKNNKV
jgi:hypothetical protein